MTTLTDVHAALYRERNGDPDLLEAELHAPGPAPLTPTRRPAEYLPVPELVAHRNLRDLTDALDGTAWDGDIPRAGAA